MTRRNVLIAVAVMLVASIAFYFLVWSPLDEQEIALNDETAALDSQAQQLRNQLISLQSIRDNELMIRADLNRLRSLIPADEPAQPSFVRAVQLAADASGTSIQSLIFSQPTLVEGAPPADAEGQVLTEIGLSGIVEGGYFQLVDLFRRLEIEVVRAVQIDTVILAAGPDGFPTLSAAVTGRIFALLPVTIAEVPPPPTVDEEGQPVDGATPTPSPTPAEATQ